jgi:Ca-activated chloride channel family protein
LDGFSFHFPYVLLLLPAVAYWAWQNRNLAQRTEASVRFPDIAELAASPSRKARLAPWLPRFRPAVLLLGLIALARPQAHHREEKVRAEVVDILLAMDVSGSMMAKDFEPNRLEVTKQMAAQFVDARPNDRMGLVAFAGEGYTLCPLTLDHRQLKSDLARLKSGVLEDGTAMGIGLGMAVARLKDSPSRSKVAILLTDGVNNAGDVQPTTAAELARDFSIKVYTIGVGTRGLAPTPIAQRQDGEYVYGISEVNIDEALLQQLAETTGGRYFRATDERSLSDIYREIDRLERSQVEVTHSDRTQELFHWFLAPALLLLAIEILLRNTYLKTLV